MSVIFTPNKARITRSLTTWAANLLRFSFVVYFITTPFYGGKLLVDKVGQRAVQFGDELALIVWMCFVIGHWFVAANLWNDIERGTEPVVDEPSRVKFVLAALYLRSWPFYLWTNIVIHVLPYVVFGVLLQSSPDQMLVRAVFVAVLTLICHAVPFLAGHWLDAKESK